MEKIIKIGDIDVKLSNNVAWTMEYRDQFNKDVMETMMPIMTSLIETVSTIITESGTVGQIGISDIMESLQGRAFEITLPLTQLGFTDSVINVVWAMAKASDPSIDPPRQWVRQFETFPLDEIVPEVGQMILTGFASSKNVERLRTMIQGIKETQPTKKE